MRIEVFHQMIPVSKDKPSHYVVDVDVPEGGQMFVTDAHVLSDSYATATVTLVYSEDTPGE